MRTYNNVMPFLHKPFHPALLSSAPFSDFGLFPNTAGSTLAVCFGGWDKFLQTLLLFMAIDWFTGGILLPAVFGKSPKSENGALESRAGWKGLCRKGMTLLYVLIASRLDALMGTEYLRDAVCIGFITNEGLSIIENAGLMGLPLPESICQAIDVLKRHSQNTIEKQT